MEQNPGRMYKLLKEITFEENNDPRIESNFILIGHGNPNDFLFKKGVSADEVEWSY